MHQHQPTPDPTTDPTTDAGILARLGIEGITAEIENTGGGVMVVTAQRNAAHGLVAITWDGDAYMVGTYPADTWREGASEDLAAHRRPATAAQMVADVRAGLDHLATIATLDQPRQVQAQIAWQYRTQVEHPAGYVAIDVPGGVILASVDHPAGVYGGFYLLTDDGPSDRPAPIVPSRAPLTFANAGVWDVDRIVSALTDPTRDLPARMRILDDYMS